MFYHVKDLQFNARVSQPDPRFARVMLEAFGGANGELKSALQYFVQAFSCHNPYPDKYDMLMDIATEEFGHLEIVGATIQMLLGPVNGEMKDVLEDTPLRTMMGGKAGKEDLIHQAFTNPAFLVTAPGSPVLTDSNGNPWCATYVSANADLTVDLRSNMAGEARAKIGYENLIPLTDDPLVKETLTFLMTREVTHFQQFEAALETIQPNFPPGVFQTSPDTVTFILMIPKERKPADHGTKAKVRGSKKNGNILRIHWRKSSTDGLLQRKPKGTKRTEKEVRQTDEKLAKERSSEILSHIPKGEMRWCEYGNAKNGNK